MANHVCQVKNNSTIQIRVVIISMHGTVDFKMDVGETWAVTLQDGIKELIAWDLSTEDLVVEMVIEVTGASLFRVFLASMTASPIMVGPLPASGTVFTPTPLTARYSGEPLPAAGS